MKVGEKTEARRCRSEDGMSIKVIAKQLNVAVSSVSRWVRDIALTEKQKKILEYNFKVKNSYESRIAGGSAISKKWYDKRLEWQQQGRLDAKNGDWLHTAGCMLYWAEGRKRHNLNVLEFSNSDADMLRLWMRFLVERLGVSKDFISLSINCYTDIHSAAEIEGYWLSVLGLSKERLRKTIINNNPVRSLRKMNGLSAYGTCQITVCDVSLIQRVYGSIQQYGGFNRDSWVLGKGDW